MHNTRLPTTASALSLLIAVTVAFTPASRAQEGTRNVHVLEQRPFVQALRAEVVPMFGYTLNEVMYQYMQVAGTARFHIDENWSIGGTYGYYFSDTTSTFDEVQEQFELFPEKSFIRWYAGGEIAWSPLYAKMVLFGSWIVHWNAYLTAGAGVTKTGSDGVQFTGMVGVGTRFFLTRWLTFNLEVRDYIFSEPFKGGDELINNVVLHAGFGIFIPFGFTYKLPK